MAYSEAQKRATGRYMKEHLDDIKIRVPKGRREEIKAHAALKGMSLNAYINDLIEKDMQNEEKPDTTAR